MFWLESLGVRSTEDKILPNLRTPVKGSAGSWKLTLADVFMSNDGGQDFETGVLVNQAD
jgi:hypothetical protein